MSGHTILVLPKNTDTDQILTAESMKYDPSSPEGRKNLGERAFCGLPAGFPEVINPQTHQSHYSLVIAGENFGCGSSREHAPVAMGMAGIKWVIAPSFARIFFRNCISSGEVLPLVAPTLDPQQFQSGQQVELEVSNLVFWLKNQNNRIPIEPLGPLQERVEAGGLFQYARHLGRL